MTLRLVPSDDPVLRQPAKPVDDPSSVRELARELTKMLVTEGGVGLAAPQVGQGLRLFVTGVDDRNHIFINPEITWKSDKEIWWEEGCLSLPRLYGEVRRPKQVTVRYTDEHGAAQELKADGLLARVIQHEHDHLEGILFPDRMQDLSTLRKVSEEEWQSRFRRDEGERPE